MNPGARRPGRLARGILGGIVGGTLGAGLSWFGGSAVARSFVSPIGQEHMGGDRFVALALVILATVVGAARTAATTSAG